MTYQETTEYLFNQMPMFEKQGATGYKEGLQNTLALDAHFNHPHKHFLTIHVAGTNGKGSCSHTLASILQQCGYKVGLYTSPHLVDFRERIRINGTPISEQYVIDFVEKEKHFFEPLHPSFFEVTTALAFKYFYDQNVDIAVIEVGLGGRLDCTNIITPILSVITNISFDHTQFLGNTLAKIAGEKAGIIKRGIPVVIGEANSETRPVFSDKAKAENAPIIFAEDAPEVSEAILNGNEMDYTTRSFGNISGDLCGLYQKKNANTILTAIDILAKRTNIFYDTDLHKCVAEGFKHVTSSTGLCGRWQTIRKTPLVICDTGHNVGGWQYLGKQIKNIKSRQKHIVFGMVGDKDVDGVLRLLPKDAKYYFTRPANKRAMPEKDMQAHGERFGLRGKCYHSVIQAYEAALKEALPNDFVFVGGSSYVVADFLAALH